MSQCHMTKSNQHPNQAPTSIATNDWQPWGRTTVSAPRAMAAEMPAMWQYCWFTSPPHAAYLTTSPGTRPAAIITAHGHQSEHASMGPQRTVV